MDLLRKDHEYIRTEIKRAHRRIDDMVEAQKSILDQVLSIVQSVGGAPAHSLRLVEPCNVVESSGIVPRKHENVGALVLPGLADPVLSEVSAKLDGSLAHLEDCGSVMVSAKLDDSLAHHDDCRPVMEPDVSAKMEDSLAQLENGEPVIEAVVAAERDGSLAHLENCGYVMACDSIEVDPGLDLKKLAVVERIWKEYNAPFVLLPTEDEAYRVRTDVSKLNSITVQDVIKWCGEEIEDLASHNWVDGSTDLMIIDKIV